MNTSSRFIQPEPPLSGATRPNSIAGWKAAADALLSHRCCAFHRNSEISARYAWLHSLRPSGFKWAAMAAIASHHIRIALFPLRLDTDRTGYLDLPRSLRRRRLLSMDVNTIRETNNAIFDDIFWVHLAYATDAGGISDLRRLLRPDAHYAQVLAGFEEIHRGQRTLDAGESSDAERGAATDAIWRGNSLLLEHEQRALVQPNFDRLSCTFARLASIGSATSFEVRGLPLELGFFTSFYGYAFTAGLHQTWRARAWPRISRYDNRWTWLESSVMPRFRNFDARPPLLETSLRRIAQAAIATESMPCIPIPETP